MSCVGSPTTTAPGPPACSAAYWASSSASEAAAGGAAVVGSVFPAIGAAVAAAVGAGALVGVGVGSSPHAANPKTTTTDTTTGIRRRFRSTPSLPRLRPSRTMPRIVVTASIPLNGCRFAPNPTPNVVSAIRRSAHGHPCANPSATPS